MMGWKDRRDELLAAQRDRSSAHPPVADPLEAGADADDETPCDPSRPCRARYESDDDLCCSHHGLCHDKAHAHFDAEEYFEWAFENYSLDRAERGINRVAR